MHLLPPFKCALRTSISQNALPVPVPWRKRTIDEWLPSYKRKQMHKFILFLISFPHLKCFILFFTSLPCLKHFILFLTLLLCVKTSILLLMLLHCLTHFISHFTFSFLMLV